MKLLVATRADKNIRDLTVLTHPIIKKFAKRWDADFLVLNHNANCDDPLGKIHYRIMQFYDLLNEYDRIIHLDSDIVINKNCPNLFDIVPGNKIGTIFEDRGSRQIDRLKRILRIQKVWGDITWHEGYINTGVFVVSRLHREIFKRFKGRLWTIKWGYDDVHLGYQINRLGMEIHELDYRFNHMCMFSELWNGSPLRFDSHIIHYAGKASFPDKGKRNRPELMKDDIRRIYG